MKKKSLTTTSQAGFTLVETLIAILILAMTIGALLSLTAGGFFTIRYAKNDIVANNLLQESLEYIHNVRDTASQQGVSWDAWKASLGFPGASCFSADGCMINPYAQSPADTIVACAPSGCENILFYETSTFYGYATPNTVSQSGEQSFPTSFVRTVTATEGLVPTQVIVTAKISWMNGTNKKTITQSIILSKWNLQ